MAKVEREGAGCIRPPEISALASIKPNESLRDGIKLEKVGGGKDELANPEKAERRDFWEGARVLRPGNAE